MATLTVNIELAAEAALAFSGAPELTIGYQVAGTTTEQGLPVQRLIRVYDAATGALIDTTQSDPGTGDYFIDLLGNGSDVYVQCLGSGSYGPLVHGPIVPDRR